MSVSHAAMAQVMTASGNFAALDADGPDCYVATRNMCNNPTPRTGRRGPLRRHATLVERMDRKVSVNKGMAIDRRRQQIIEPVFVPD